MAAKKKSTKTTGAVLPGLAASMPAERETVRIRKISNGFVVTRETYNGKGQYREHEMYTPKKPNLMIPTPGKPKR